NLLLDKLFGAQIVYVADRKDRDRILQETFERGTREGKKPYLVPYGGSNSTGAVGYAFAMKELIDQNVAADWIVFATSSGGTHATASSRSGSEKRSGCLRAAKVCCSIRFIPDGLRLA